MNVIELDVVDSTNKFVKENNEKLVNFTFVSALEQTSGKGRNDRIWTSKKGENLLFSFILKDPKLLAKFKALSIGTATLVARFLELIGIKNVKIKWPNDVYVNDKKICGILLEGDITKYLVVGVGLNLNQTQFNGDFRAVPTSVKLETGIEHDLDQFRVDLFEFIHKHINQNLFVLNTLKFYKKHDYLINRSITINNIKGIVNGINDDFELLVDGKSINSGEVII